VSGLLAGVLAIGGFASTGWCKTASSKKSTFKPHADILKGYQKVVSTADGKKSLYTLWTRKKDGQMYAELPSGFASQKYFFAMTVSSGDRFAGLQRGDMYVYWKRFDKRLALISPNIAIRSTGDSESKASVKRLFTDRVILDVPIVTIGPGGGPVIDMDALLVGQSSKFFGPYNVSRKLMRLITIKKAKAFPNNVEVAFEVPSYAGRLQTLHYSISKISGSTGYKPRKADERIGYFTTSYSDLGKYSDDETRVRYINRGHLEKRAKKLTLSPPKVPITFYIEHTTPVRYRRWVKQGILQWNKAFEKVGISDAIVVLYQDASTGDHMEKDPEDVRFNFVRWLNNDISMAIGPSRVHPSTGQILDADIILTDGWIRHYRHQFSEVFPKIAMEGFNAETLVWLAKHPNWDPRIRLAAPAEREHLKMKLARRAAMPYGGHAMARVDGKLIGDDRFDGLIGRTSQVNGMCLASQGMAFDVALMRMSMAIFRESQNADAEKDDKDKDQDDEEKDKDKKTKKKKEMIDGMPEAFIGSLLAHLVAHEVGHTLGLRHNFKGSSTYTLGEINSEKIKGKKPFGSSVMDYIPVNMNMQSGDIQGDYTLLGIGPYDHWAIEYGYTFAKDLKPILDRVAEPELQYATDEDLGGPDPLARRYDFSKNPLDYAHNQIRLAKHHRGRIIDKFVKDGQSWSKARRGYEITLNLQMRAVSMMANWIGGAFVHRDKKGDKNARVPIEVVPTKTQRDALEFVLENTFYDEAFGLTPDLLSRMTVDKWLDGDGFHSVLRDEPTWPVHDKIMGLQASTLTMLMNPSTLRRVYDNEFRVPADQDMLTLPELLSSIGSAIWNELDKKPDKQYTARVPMITSLRRNLQREHLTRLIDLILPGAGSNEAFKPISNLSLMELRRIRTKIAGILKAGGEKIDPYTQAHLSEAREQITKALDSQYIYNAKSMGGGSTLHIHFHKEPEPKSPND
jgi:hypothetical protein